ncbi:MAG: DUF924 family protein [Pseudomonas sp.]|uniref:DUF924 family protein n=1 Tax=Pseudomonas sp. TaxID=306 RepID=UPI003D0A3541
MGAPWQPLLDWWFGSDPQATAAEAAASQSRLWFGKRDSQDQEARKRFGELVSKAMAGELSAWQAHPSGWLATVLLLDQLPRMIFRDTPQAFAGDSQAQALVETGLASGLDQQLAPLQRVFIYLVLEHAEDPLAQARSVDLFAGLHTTAAAADRAVFADYLDYAQRHQQVIERFSRFPHRNGILGRASSAEEQAFLLEPGSRF